mmetsp:Transcript_7898/g.11956  ORF Transcript_7898/g.11956 Transcript_7898/m.11956 type:complete len:165 (-) Transcript_7898:136-630(-)|eukprot:CAMPEP_0171452452 /NCGR_PEP_ID=MMETSP0945-20130129/555_1 /TAXON_ID=109269 /ORGANISM="Vaucheria litorea, Strain CCMP2940" /LENGTH=164 /DNA_ID=CAMNT_0011977123 /DNA_START=100 /DNA_END=594 /DNA_ORIENTATION=-
MGKFLKQGKVVVILQGRFAGRKAVIVKTFEEGTGGRKFQHMLVAGIDKGPKKVTRAMSKKKLAKRLTIRPFVKMVNFNHVMPTRYQVDLDLKKIELNPKKVKEGETATPTVVSVDEEAVSDPAKRKMAKKAVKKVFQAGLHAQNDRKNAKAVEGVKYFYQKLRF